MAFYGLDVIGEIDLHDNDLVVLPHDVLRPVVDSLFDFNVMGNKFPSPCPRGATNYVSEDNGAVFCRTCAKYASELSYHPHSVELSERCEKSWSCPPGSFAVCDNPGWDHRYCDAGGICALCGAGTFSTKVGAVDVSTCQPCPAGTASPSEGARPCRTR